MRVVCPATRGAVLAVALVLTVTAQRPLALSDANSWNSILSPKLSPDGKWLAYGLYPQEGDGFIVVRSLATGQEHRYPGGARPPAGPKDPEREAPPPLPMNTVLYSADSRTVLVNTFPAKAEVDAARKAKKRPEEMPKNSLLIVDLASGKPASIARVKSFQVGEDAGRNVVYQKEPEPPVTNEKKDAAAPAEAKSEKKEKPPATSDLVIRNLDTGAERTISSVTEYVLSKDGATVACAVFAKEPAKSGVFVIEGTGEPAAVLEGKGKYVHLTWDRQQKQLAMVSDRDKESVFKLYLWTRGGATAQELVSPDTPGFRSGYGVSEKGPVSFSPDGSRIYLSCAPVKPKPAAEPDPDAEKPVFDLWRWKDDFIPPMQKVRYVREQNRSYLAAFDTAAKHFVQLGDPTLAEITPADAGGFALGTDDRPYRRSIEYLTRRYDAYLVDVSTGARTQIGKQLYGGLSWSPDGRYLAGFESKQWYTVAVPSGVHTVLTAKLGVNFYNESWDAPSSPGAYGSAGWTKDGKWLIVYDRFDVWALAPDGSTARNLTAGEGRREKNELRVVRFPKNADDKWIDPSIPLLLRAENQDTYDSGFYRVPFDGSARPLKLTMAARYYTPPVKAKNAGVFLLTGSTFEEFPDLLTTDAGFREMRKASDANPQKKEFLWGTSELMWFRSGDGVPLKAALFKPAGFDPHKKYPLIVYIYERMSQTVRHFIDPRPFHVINASQYTSNGYLVLMPDIVYTIGYPGQSALKCVLPAVNALVAKGYVDEKAIGIQGHSWGGYEIAYMVTQTKMFKAAAAGAVVSDMVSAYDGIRWGPGLPRQFQYEHQQSRIGGSLWEYPERYIANSPIFQADRVETPLLLLHNDADDAVPWYQGIEYFLALRRLGKEVYMFNYNGEFHGPRKRVNAKDYARRLQEFFDYELKGAPEPDWMSKGIPYRRP